MHEVHYGGQICKAIFNHAEYDVTSEPSWMTSFYSFILCVFVYDSIDTKWLTNVFIHQKQQSQQSLIKKTKTFLDIFWILIRH